MTAYRVPIDPYGPGDLTTHLLDAHDQVLGLETTTADREILHALLHRNGPDHQPQPCPACRHDMSMTPTHNVRPCAECDDAAQLGEYAPCQTVELPAGAELADDLDTFADELVAEYAAAIERVRDRAQEARYGGRLYRTFANDPRYAASRSRMTTEPTPEQRAAIVRERTAGRLQEYGRDGWTGDAEAFGGIPGGCSWMSEEVERDYGWRLDGGCYVAPRGHIAHVWNVLPDGRVLDTTADQFNEPDVPADGIRIAAAGDPRYDSTCDCEDQVG